VFVMFRFGVAVLATWRVAHLLAREDGPGDVLVRLRRRVSGGFGRMLDCVYCLSLWISAPIALWVTRDPLDWLVSMLAISGGACLLERLGDEPVDIRSFEPREHEEAVYALLRTTPHVDG
jgi:hypothetical protein